MRREGRREECRSKGREGCRNEWEGGRSIKMKIGRKGVELGRDVPTLHGSHQS